MVKRKLGDNYLFYTNQIPSRPNGATIDKIHEVWKGDYALLEAHHSYIQWLFPLYEGPGVNYAASALTKEEAEVMRNDEKIGLRVALSYELMLDFYGMKLNRQTGEGRTAQGIRFRPELLNTISHIFIHLSMQFLELRIGVNAIRI